MGVEGGEVGGAPGFGGEESRSLHSWVALEEREVGDVGSGRGGVDAVGRLREAD